MSSASSVSANDNSFLQRSTRTSGRTRLAALSVGITLVVIRCWKDSRIWQDLVARLPSRWQVPLQACMAQWRGTTAEVITRLARTILRVVQEQLAPFARMTDPNNNSMLPSASLTTSLATPKNGNHNNDNDHNKVGKNGDAPTSIISDGFSTAAQMTTAPMSSDRGWGDYEDRVRQNQALIAKVLHYWFGQYEPDIAQKKLWMIAASSGTYRQQIDAEIAELFLPLLCELAGAEAASNTSNENADNGKDDRSNLSACRWQQWCTDKELYGCSGKLAAIIVLDQFSRHIRRHQEESSQTDNNSKAEQTGDAHYQKSRHNVTLPSQQVLDQLALRTARLFTEGHAQEIQCGMVPIPQYIFGLMPYRHASTLESVTYVQQCVEHAANLNVQLECMSSRFRKASNRRMAVLQDEARRMGKATTVVEKARAEEKEGVESENGHATTTKVTFQEDDILEIFPFDADMSDAPNHPIVKTIEAFLQEQGIHPVVDPNSSGNKKNKNNKKSKEKQQQQIPHSGAAKNLGDTETKPSSRCSLILSLSGGVDSMVIASVLAFLKSKGGYPQLDIVAIHIDYANRPESKAEADYVEKYCRNHDIRFVVRRIDEITRGITARDEYETQARQVRYDMYRTVALDCIKRHPQATVGVMLGHHRGDLRENVLSNAHKGCGPLDLSGMTAVSQNDGVTIYRPLLPLEKTDVYDYSHRYGVPYFKDTTPHWSTRGKLRNKLLPLLEEIYGEGSMNNLSTLATESDECRDLLQGALLKPFMDRVVRTPMGISFETAPFVAQATGLFFWKFVLREVLHSAGLGMFSDKSVISFLERIRPVHTYKKSIREGWLQCRRDYAVYLQADGRVFVFYPDSFPWRKSEGYKCIDQVADITQQNTIVVGPWIVEAEVCDPETPDRDALVKRKAVSSMLQFMEGFIEYYLEVPTEEADSDVAANNATPEYRPVPLLFVSSFRKSNRPPSWKNTDEKIQEILPLLGLSEDSFQDLKNRTDEKPVLLLRVTLDRRFSSD